MAITLVEADEWKMRLRGPCLAPGMLQGQSNGAFTPKKAGAAQIHKVKTRTRLEAHFCKKNLCMSWWMARHEHADFAWFYSRKHFTKVSFVMLSCDRKSSSTPWSTEWTTAWRRKGLLPFADSGAPGLPPELPNGAELPNSHRSSRTPAGAVCLQRILWNLNNCVGFSDSLVLPQQVRTHSYIYIYI